MYSKPIIFPLDANGTIYALQDEEGNTIGTGSREVCEVLLFMITRNAASPGSAPSPTKVSLRPNVRAAIGF
jgi:hypothetical protein